MSMPTPSDEGGEVDPQQSPWLKAAKPWVHASVPVGVLDADDTRLEEASLDLTTLGLALAKYPDPRLGVEVVNGHAVLELSEDAQEVLEDGFGPLPETLSWERSGTRYFLFRSPFVEETSLCGGGRALGPKTMIPVPPLKPESEAPEFAWISQGKEASLPSELRKMLAAPDDSLLNQTEDDEAREGAAVPRVEILSRRELADLASPAELIEGLGMAGGEIALLYGPSGAGKSFVALDFSLHVATGLPWQGRDVQRGTAVYVGAESPKSLHPRIEAWEQAKELKVHDGRFLPLFPFHFDLTKRESLEALARTLADQVVRPKLIVLDTVSAVMAGEDENSSPAVTALLRHARELAERFGACVLLVHHAGKDASRGARGHGAFGDWPDVRITAKDKGGEVTELVWDKIRDAERGWHIALRRVPSGPSCVLESEAGPASPEPVVEPGTRVLSALESLGGSAPSGNKLLDRMGGNRTRGRDEIESMVTAGWVESLPGSRGGTAYRLVSEEDRSAPVPGPTP